MITPDYAMMMARYNRWQNRCAFEAAETLDDKARDLDRGAFFGSIRHTLNHLYWGDSIWMNRFDPSVAKPSRPGRQSAYEFEDWQTLADARPILDEAIISWASRLKMSDLEGELSWYSGVLKSNVTTPLALCVLHFFNHQTHHRGQVHAMLTAAGCKTDDTDLFAMPESV
ncbi:MAG: DinB family protein [Ahrensia sp.]|nr:DinB family protein [Ahrensia sp.]